MLDPRNNTGTFGGRFAGELFIHGIGEFHPENIVDNAFLTSLDIGTDEQWILERVGIRQRRTVLPLDYIRQTKNARRQDAHAVSLYHNGQTGAKAAQKALQRAGLTPAQIGLVIAGGCSPEYTIPAEACIVAAELGIQAPAMDVSSACSSFAAQMNYLRAMKPEALPDYVLVVNTENNTRVVDYADRRSAVLWGDCSVATIVSPRIPSRFAITYTTLTSDPAGWKSVVIPVSGPFSQNGHAVQTFAIKKTQATLAAIRGELRRDPTKMYFISHQANLTMLQSVCERAEVPADRHLYNVDEYGNCGAAGAPSVLSQNWEKFREGDEIGLVVVGSGLTWGGMLIDVRGNA